MTYRTIEKLVCFYMTFFPSKNCDFFLYIILLARGHVAIILNRNIYIIIQVIIYLLVGLHIQIVVYHAMYILIVACVSV